MCYGYSVNLLINKKIMKAYYKELPSKFEPVGNGSFLYRMNINEVVTENETSFECDEFVVWKMEREEIVRTVIDTLFGHGIEQKLINDFNAANAGILPDSYKDAYIEYLNKRKDIKEQIKVDVEINYMI